MDTDFDQLRDLIASASGPPEPESENLSVHDIIRSAHQKHNLDPIERWTNDFWTCFHRDHVEDLKFQLEHRPDGASVDVPLGGYIGRSMFFNCCDSNRSKKFLRLLLQHGSNGLNEVDNLGNTALDIASMNGHLSIVRFLIQSGADYTRPNPRGYFPLHHAIRSGRAALIQFWLKQSPNSFYALLMDGNTPFHLAARSINSRSTLELLIGFAKISAEKWVNLPNAQGETPFVLAIKSGHRLMIQSLIVLGGRIIPGEVEKILKGRPWPVIELLVACSEIEIDCISENRRLEIRRQVYFSSSLTQRLILELDTI